MRKNKKRIFIALPLPPSAARSVKKIVAECERHFDDFSGGQIRFVPPENQHITVSFIGDADDIMIPMIADAAAAASRAFGAPEIVFEKISYAPPARGRGAESVRGDNAAAVGEKSGAARMIWLAADRATSERIAKIKNVLEDGLAARGVPFQSEMKIFSGHVTLARFAKETARASLPQIEKPLQLSFSAPSLDLMESDRASDGARYGILQSFNFKGES